jgi:hypothetical protein
MHGGAVGRDTALQALKSRVRLQMRVSDIFRWLNPSGRNMVLRSTQPVTEMSTRDISGGEGDRSVGLKTLPSFLTLLF